MLRVRTYRVRPDAWALGLFLLVMLPNFIWFAVPAADDILRQASATPGLDSVATALQAAGVAALCMLSNTHRPPYIAAPLRGGIVTAVALYFAAWALYYAGVHAAPVLLALCLAPCAALLLLAAGRRNGFALLLLGAFAVCHTVSTALHFLF